MFTILPNNYHFISHVYHFAGHCQERGCMLDDCSAPRVGLHGLLAASQPETYFKMVLQKKIGLDRNDHK